MKREWQLFLTALSFYTRIYVPKFIHEAKPEYLNNSIRYFSLIGWFTGFLSAVMFFLFDFYFDQSTALIFSMLAVVLITGAIHEDGFADVCDGFGGGWSKEKILEIMKDSSVGAFGVIGLVFILLLKFFALNQFMNGLNSPGNWVIMLLIFMVGHCLSRFNASIMVFTHIYVREETSKSAALVGNRKINLYLSCIFGLLPLILLSIHTTHYEWLYLLLPIALVQVFLSRFFNKWIGGYTGDCLGAIQQVSEVVIYLSAIILWRYI
ncbi:MAG TPA: adenosylcobinamide-GDP ribazoletransferase [Pedobacter sp.]|jgi:adenosylcobinamide-GDP ribazoletransferase